MSGTPAHGTLSGYVNDDCRWTYSVFDANTGEWRDVGDQRHEALQFAASLPEPRRPAE
ncbi:hypothetical protein [Actinophytocola sp.]|uniref:hypothetical protein n=1 Tax=Actinophytocola sp. TaxID=1872138 RepID=UPI0025C26146|nr:hypothetical protein [Actinophytocola sp.]